MSDEADEGGRTRLAERLGRPPSVWDTLEDHDVRISHTERWQYKADGALSLTRFVLGASLVSSAVSLLTLVMILTGHKP